MKNTVLLTLLLAAAGSQAADSERILVGRLTDESMRPIGNAVIEVNGHRVWSDASGRFEIAAEVNGPAILRIGAAGYYDAVHAFGSDESTGDIELVARQEGRKLLMFAGDAMLARRYFDPRAGEPAIVRRDHIEEDGAALLQAIEPYIQLADYASVNLETQISSKKLKDRLPKLVTFYSPSELPALLQTAGFDYVALGNNHTWDYQETGLASTFAALEQTTLGYSGAGFDEASARAPHVANIDDQAFGFLSYVGWPGTFQPSQAAAGKKGGAALGDSSVFAQDLAEVPKNAVAVLQYHSGLEYSGMPATSERTRLRRAVDDGADIAIGHHAHVVQGLEIYRDRLIAYSMGNFLFDQYHYTTQMGMLLYVWMDGDKLHRAEVVPMHVNGYVPTPATGAMRYSILHRLARLSRPFGTCLRGNGAHATVEPCGDDLTTYLDLGSATPGNKPVPLRSMGVPPTQPVSIDVDNYAYRLGTDLLRRGDFEYSGLFDTHDRAWLLGSQVSMEYGESRHLKAVLGDGEQVRTGMKVFERVFLPSNPTTLSGRIHTNGPVKVRFKLQRRRINDGLEDSLENGPATVVGGLRIKGSGWRDFSIDFDQPRLSTRSVRLLIEIADDHAEPGGTEVLLDDLAWTEWRTPWLTGYDREDGAEFATHVQFRHMP